MPEDIPPSLSDHELIRWIIQLFASAVFQRDLWDRLALGSCQWLQHFNGFCTKWGLLGSLYIWVYCPCLFEMKGAPGQDISPDNICSICLTNRTTFQTLDTCQRVDTTNRRLSLPTNLQYPFRCKWNQYRLCSRFTSLSLVVLVITVWFIVAIILFIYA